jgi:rfaE bifunctional protein kinase chain/domain
MTSKPDQRLARWLGAFPKVRILVLGDVMVDQFIFGKVSRISPEAPVPVMVIEKEVFHLGGAANVAHNVHSLGGRVLLCGLVGKDSDGEKLRARMAVMGMDTDGIFSDDGRMTTVKTRIVAHHPHHQQLVRMDREDLREPSPAMGRVLSGFLAGRMEDCDAVILSDYGKGLLTRSLIESVIRRARRLKKLIMVDPKEKNFFAYRGATVITPNTKEAGDASGILINSRECLEKVGRTLMQRLRCEALVITQGEEGMTVFRPRKDPVPVPTVAREVFDVTGAGDTVIGTMALALAAGADMIDAANLANHAAGIVVGKKGTAVVLRKELIERIGR